MSLVYTAPRETVPTGAAGRPHGLYLGGKADAKSRSKLEGWGVTHVLNVTPEKEAGVQSGVPNYFESSSAGGGRIIYKRIPVYDAATSDLLCHADSIVGFVSTGLHHGSVLVHCKQGVSRSATCAVFFLMRKVGMTLQRALSLCRARRPDVDPIPAFMTQLQTYETKCRRLGVIREEDSDGAGSKKRKAVVGPAMRPPGPPEEVATNVTPKKKRMVGPMPPAKSLSKVNRIGPSMGPLIGPSIGPSQSPPVGQQREVEEVEPSGLAMHPPDDGKAAGEVTSCQFPARQGSDERGDKARRVGPEVPSNS